MSFMIDNMHDTDWDEVRSIYLEGIATGQATFETTAPEWEKWDAGHLDEPRLVCRQDGAVVGWAALSRVSGRCVYAGVAEVSVYVAEKCRGQSMGHAMLAALIERAEKLGIWTLQAGIFPENSASVQLHLKSGFREVGRREKLGELAGVWRDVLLLERRSKVAGVN
jgi:L-amino acid N-acyltransferase YncA